MTCKNCDTNIEGNFCSNCGQSSNVKRINAKYLLAEVSLFLLQLERGIFFTVKELFVRPGHCIREYLEGKRYNYYKPLSYLFVTSALYVFITYLLGQNTYIGDFLVGFISGAENPTEIADSLIPNWISNHQTYVLFLTIPIFSFASHLSYRKSKYNYFEHLVLNFYVTGQQMIIYLVFSLIIFEDNIFILIPIILAVSFNFWAYSQFFSKNSKLKNILLTVLTYFLYIIQLIIVVIFIAFISIK